MNTMLLRWREGFARDPQRGVADLISGRAALGGAVRLGVPEFLAREFGDADAGDPESLARQDQLDGALLGWLQQMVGDDAPAQVRRLGAPVYARRLCDALVAVQWLVLPKALGDLRARREWWHDRLHPWRLSSARDPGLELRRALTLEQQDQSLLSMWLRLADDPRDEYYAVALAGLQGMPEAGDGAAIQQHCLHAALRHAALKGDIGQARSEFNREYLALRARYPRAPSQWDSTLRDVQQAVKNGLPGRVGKLLRETLEPERKDGKTSSQNTGRRRAGMVLAPAGKAVKDALETDLDARRGTGESLATRLISICEQELSYARHSGDSYFFTRTLHNMGTKLLNKFSLSATSLERLGTLIEESLIWDPLSPYRWMLLAQWFGARGWAEQREWALRETTRLFPDHEASRVELARLLMRRGEPHWGEAEQLLRAVLGFSPRHEPSRLILAVLLHHLGPDGHAEAKQLLDAILKSNPANASAQRLLNQWVTTDAAPMPEESGWTWDSSEWAALGQDEIEVALPRSSDLSIDDPYGLADLAPRPAAPAATSHISAADQPEVSAPAVVSTPVVQAALAAPATPVTRAMWQTLQRLQGRGELQAAFKATLTSPGFTPDHTPVPERLTQAAERGDPLAGLYVQWLAPSTPLEPPPSAWAWRICRLWQSGSIESADWQQLLIEFPEHKAATLLLQSQVARQDAAVQQQMHRQRERLLQESPNALSAEQTLTKALMSQDAAVEPGQIFALLHCAAVPPPEFEAQIPQRLAA